MVLTYRVPNTVAVQTKHLLQYIVAIATKAGARLPWTAEAEYLVFSLRIVK